MRKVSNENVFEYEFKYDTYNYRILIPDSIKEFNIGSETGKKHFGLKGVNGNIFTFWDESGKSPIELSEAWKGNFYIELYRNQDGVFFTLSNRFNKNGISNYEISNDPYFTFELTIRASNYEEFTLERQLIPNQVLSHLENNKSIGI
ncbi:MAG: hypothetical protein JXR82_01005 [Marinifilaceae bacterium]|nr:hypothetical protein [Marinifilaceae bacterium]